LLDIIDNSVLYEIHPEVLRYIKYAKWNKFKWKGLTLMKDPMTLSIYQQLINDVKPKTIIEFGSYEGGSALWMHDLCQSLGLNTNIITFDINKENFKCISQQIKFKNLDSNNIEEYFKENYNEFINLEGPIIVIEDCHVNVKGICLEIDKILKSGDYLIIEDTLDITKHNTMLEFLKENKCYTVDRHYCDFWGLNLSWNVNSFLRKL
jgi:cephalosporin hydroxylase